MKFIPFDIETTGTTAESKSTVIGYLHDGTYHTHYLIPDEVSGVPVQEEEHVDNHDADVGPIKKVGYKDEENLISNAFNDLEAGMVLVGFCSNEFDLPFLRTRCVINGMDWPYAMYRTMDLMKQFQYNFNSKVVDINGLLKAQKKEFGESLGLDIKSSWNSGKIESEIVNHGFDNQELPQFTADNGIDQPTSSERTLDGLFNLVTNEEGHIEDPFDSSEEAIGAFHNGHIDDVILHNVADLYKTNVLKNIILEFVSDDEYRIKKL
jgi:hypothetical protein